MGGAGGRDRAVGDGVLLTAVASAACATTRLLRAADMLFIVIAQQLSAFVARNAYLLATLVITMCKPNVYVSAARYYHQHVYHQLIASLQRGRAYYDIIHLLLSINNRRHLSSPINNILIIGLYHLRNKRETDSAQ